MCQGSSVGRAGKTLILPVLKNTASANTNKKSYGIVNPRVVGSNPTLGSNASPPNDATLNTDFLRVSTTTGRNACNVIALKF